MKSEEIRKKFFEFFQEKKHQIIPSASVIPENDPTVLFNIAGMQPLVPYLLGEKHPAGTRLANVQKCIRTIDLDEVGDDSHLTFFEMLGNWSLGNYFKKEAINWSFEFLTNKEWLNIPKNYLSISVFEGDKNAPKDQESAQLWQSCGIETKKISYIGAKDNWWGPAGKTGPCGPNTEMFFWIGDGKPTTNSNVKNDEINWLEIWNDVFMEYIKDENGNFIKSPQQNVDTGMGLERITTVLNGKKSVYDTDIFQEIIAEIVKITKKPYQENFVINKNNFNSKDEQVVTIKNIRIIADHVRTATIMLADGVRPSNIDQGYILRRLIRRAIRSGYKLGTKESFLEKISEIVITKFTNIYDSVKNNSQIILEEITKEENRFRKTLQSGLKEFDKVLQGMEIAFKNTGRKNNLISGKKAFKLYDTYGFPIEMTKELATENGLKVDEKGFLQEFEKHQKKSREGAAQKFKGGLADNSEKTTALHTATHLLHQSLKNILGDHVIQRGANITAERLRFDFSHPQKLTDEEKTAIENMVNDQIKKNLAVNMEEMNLADAKKLGAIGIFENKYGEKVKVYSVGDFSKEICGGPHVKNTKDLGVFKIKKEQASSAGVRRIRAILL